MTAGRGIVHSERSPAERWNKGEFPKVPGDEKEFIPIPAVPLTQGRT